MAMYRLVLLLLCFGPLCPGQSAEQPCGEGALQHGKALAEELPAQRIEAVRAVCRKRGFPAADTDALMAALRSARQEALPAECLLLRIEEGLSKQVPAARLKAAVEQRLELLRRADALVMQVRGSRGGQHQHLVSHLAMALESGLTEEVLSEVFHRHPDFRYGRMIHVIEAGEALRLEGLAPADAGMVMNECLDRDLTRPEVFRVAGFIASELRKGRTFAAIHRDLWNPAE